MKKIKRYWGFGKKRFENLQIRNKILVSFYLILLPIILIGVGIVFVWDVINKMDEELQLYQRFTETVSVNIGYLQGDILDISDYFAVNNDVHSILIKKNGSENKDSLFWTRNTSLPFVSDILAIKSHIKTVALYPENGFKPYFISRDASVHIKETEDIRELSVYQDTIDAQGDVIWRSVKEGKENVYLNNKSEKMVAYRMLFDLSKKRKLGMLAIGIEMDSYNEILINALQNRDEGIVLMDDAGNVLASQGRANKENIEYIKKNIQAFPRLSDKYGKVETEDSYIFYSRNERASQNICLISPKSNWSILKKGDVLIPSAMFFMFIVLALPLSSMICSNLTKSTKKLLQSMKNFQNGDFSERVEVKSEDEIGQLSIAFNKMAEDTQTLIKRNYVMALKEREIELNALQAQINPHFLYNVLDSLYWEAIDAGSEQMGEDILALSELFRLLLSGGESEVLVKDEVRLISSYLQIQSMRFSKRFSYTIEVEEEIKKYKISKLMIQPFVENAIVHGFERKKEDGYVKLTGKKKGEMLEFIIEDDGVGMTQEQINSLLQKDEQTGYPNLRIGHYAIRNILERLELRYGSEYVLKIESKKEQGTRVYILIPITH